MARVFFGIRRVIHKGERSQNSNRFNRNDKIRKRKKMIDCVATSCGGCAIQNPTFLESWRLGELH